MKCVAVGLSFFCALSMSAYAWADAADGGAQGDISVLTPPQLNDWEEKSFQGQTRYTPEVIDGRTVIKAESRGNASGLIRKVEIDLRQTPYLHWSWRVDNVLHDIDETTRSGDDYPARIYVVISGGLLFWRTRALNYVWSSTQPVGSHWDNAFTGNAVMLAIRSGLADTAGAWRHERRNVLQDLARYLGNTYTHIDAVAIMSDTDNSGQQATAYYGEIYFSAQ